MDRSEWMYRWSRLEPQYLVHVRKFVAAAKSHRESLNQMTTICPCSHYMNMRDHEDSVAQSHLIRFDFVKDYTIWTFHGKKVHARWWCILRKLVVVDNGQCRPCRTTRLISSSNN